MKFPPAAEGTLKGCLSHAQPKPRMNPTELPKPQGQDLGPLCLLSPLTKKQDQKRPTRGSGAHAACSLDRNVRYCPVT